MTSDLDPSVLLTKGRLGCVIEYQSGHAKDNIWNDLHSSELSGGLELELAIF